MTLTENLKKEFSTDKPAGNYAPFYFRYLGYREDLNAPKTTARANAIYTLFSEPGAYIYPSDLIAGSLRPLWTGLSDRELNYARGIDNSFGYRSFRTNSDHFAPDYARVLRLGVPGLLAEIDASLEKHAGDEEKTVYLASMRRTVEGFVNLIANHRSEALGLLEKNDGTYSPERLRFIADNCAAILQHPPVTFAQGLQLIWFCDLAFYWEGRAAMALSRLDQFLYPLYAADIKAGRLTREAAVGLLENTFMKIYERYALQGNNDVVNICIGGTNPDGSCAINDLSYDILHAVGNCNVPGPNLSARITEHTPDDFLDECLKVIGTGLGYPALMNDAVNMAALSRYGYKKEDVCNYSMVGCIENFITGKQPPWSDGRYDTPRFFEYIFNRGVGMTHESVGVDTGDLGGITSMDEFMARFERQLAYGAAEYVMNFNNANTMLNPKAYTQPFLSCFCEDCIGRGLDVNDGGAVYPSVHGVAVMGIGTTTDALAAIEKTVFVDHTATLEDIRRGMANNFEGEDELRRLLLDAPKYGNNDPFADKYAVWFVDFLGQEFGRYRTRDGGGFYLCIAANTSNIWAGKNIGATPDGRLAGEPLSDAASPTYGRDTRGATCTLSSVSKPDYTKVATGSVVNQKFSPSMFGDEKRARLAALIRVYFKRGGQEIQMNATSRAVLIDAMEHPENYGDLVVRVSGFSALYVTLNRDVQLDILHRTQQE